MTAVDSIPPIGKHWPGWGYGLRGMSSADRELVAELRGEVADPNTGLNFPSLDSDVGYLIVDLNDHPVGVLGLLNEKLELAFVTKSSRRRGLAFAAIGVLLEAYFANPRRNSIAMSSAIGSEGGRLVARLCGSKQQKLSRERWVSVVRPAILFRLGGGPGASAVP